MFVAVRQGRCYRGVPQRDGLFWVSLPVSLAGIHSRASSSSGELLAVAIWGFLDSLLLPGMMFGWDSGLGGSSSGVLGVFAGFVGTVKFSIAMGTVRSAQLSTVSEYMLVTATELGSDAGRAWWQLHTWQQAWAAL